jgi:hypothetical protein
MCRPTFAESLCLVAFSGYLGTTSNPVQLATMVVREKNQHLDFAFFGVRLDVDFILPRCYVVAADGYVFPGYGQSLQAGIKEVF